MSDERSSDFNVSFDNDLYQHSLLFKLIDKRYEFANSDEASAIMIEELPCVFELVDEFLRDFESLFLVGRWETLENDRHEQVEEDDRHDQLEEQEVQVSDGRAAAIRGSVRLYAFVGRIRVAVKWGRFLSQSILHEIVPTFTRLNTQ